ncbi:MAG TPA: hypothetical protein VJH06_03530 [Candidatus Paceibacterota bacterium]
MFFNTKIEKFKVDPMVDPAMVQEDFKLIDDYKQNILKYIYDNIKIGPETNFETFFQSRIQMFLSQTLLRSLFLKDQMVHALNTNNFPAFYALAKAFLEIPAQLGYITYILYEDKSEEELKDALRKMVFAHQGGLTTEIELKPINVLTMFDKLDLVLKKIDLSQTIDDEEIKKIKEGKLLMRTIYEDVCNFGHPNFMSHLSVGKINKDGYWEAKNPDKLESYKYELYGGFYMHHFTTAIGTIYIMASMIVRHKKVDNFSKLNSKNIIL